MKEKATKLGVGAKIKVKLRGNSELKGIWLRLKSRTSWLRTRPEQIFAANKDIESLGNPGLSKGSKIAIGIVLGLGAAIGIFGSLFSDYGTG